MIDKRRLCDRVTDIMARALHYQERGEPDWSTMDYAAIKAEYDAVPRPIVDRYRNDAKFHAQVQRAVAMVMDEVQKAERAALTVNEPTR